MMIQTKNQITDHQDIQVEDSPEEYEHSFRDSSYMMSILCPQIFGDHSAPEVVSH